MNRIVGCEVRVEGKVSELACSCQVTSRIVATGTRMGGKIGRIFCASLETIHRCCFRNYFLFDTCYVGSTKFQSFAAFLSLFYCLYKCHILFSLLIRDYITLITEEGEEHKSKL
jgi:hypothetical protein